MLRGAHHAENIRLSGARLDQAALAAAYAAENWAEVDRLVSDDVVRRHAACGTPAQVKARLEEYRAIGLDEVIIGGVDDAPSIAAALAAARGDTTMKFSISLPTCFEGVMYPIPFVEPGDFVRMAKLCERLGYHSVWGNDHITTQHYVRELFPGKPPNFYELLTVLSFCAAATTTLKVGTAVAVPPMRDPFWLAKQAATIDQLSDGRLILGAGRRRLSRGIRRLGAPARAHRPARRDARRGHRADAAAVHRARG